MQTDYQKQRENYRGQFHAVIILACSLGVSMGGSSFADMSNFPVRLMEKRTIVEGTYQLSPPAIQFDEAGMLHLAWFEKSGETPTLKTARISDGGSVVGETVRVNPEGIEPDALHQAPGLAAGKDNHLFMTWSSERKGGMFASDLRLARSTDGGVTFNRWRPIWNR